MCRRIHSCFAAKVMNSFDYKWILISYWCRADTSLINHQSKPANLIRRGSPDLILLPPAIISDAFIETMR